MTKRRAHLRRSYRPSHRTKQSWTHLLFFLFLLVMLLLFYSKLGSGAAGCFGAVADPEVQIEILPAGSPDPSPVAPSKTNGPGVRVEKQKIPD